jgi:hypothetical protein
MTTINVGDIICYRWNFDEFYGIVEVSNSYRTEYIVVKWFDATPAILNHVGNRLSVWLCGVDKSGYWRKVT